MLDVTEAETPTTSKPTDLFDERPVGGNKGNTEAISSIPTDQGEVRDATPGAQTAIPVAVNEKCIEDEDKDLLLSTQALEDCSAIDIQDSCGAVGVITEELGLLSSPKPPKSAEQRGKGSVTLYQRIENESTEACTPKAPKGHNKQLKLILDN